MTIAQNWSKTSLTRNQNLFRSGSNSPRINGKLRMRDNPFKFYKTEATRVSVVETRTVAPDFRNRSYVKGGYSDLSYFFANQTTPSSGLYVLSDEVNKLRIKVSSAIRSQDINLAVAYAEKTETANLLKGTAQKLTSAARRLKRGDLYGAAKDLGLPHPPRGRRRGRGKGGKSTGSTLADKWLEYSYGWVPLYNDMYGAMVAFDKAMQDDGDRIFVAEAEARFVAVKYFPTPLRLFSIHHQVVVNRTIKQRLKLRTRYKITNPNLHTVDSLGLLNPALVAWELVPFSFVVDWFSPIGDWLQSLPPLAGVSLLSTFKTVVSDELTQVDTQRKQDIAFLWDTPVGAPPLPNYLCKQVTSSVLGAAVKSFFYCERTPDTLNVSIVPPKLEVPTAWQQAASAVALLTSTLESLRRK